MHHNHYNTWLDVDRLSERNNSDVVLQRVFVELWVDDDPRYLPLDAADVVRRVVVGEDDVDHGEQAGLHPGQAVGGRHEVSICHQARSAEYVAPWANIVY